MEDFRRLEVWRRAHTLAIAVNRACRALPWYERVELGRQMRRAATSVSFNIAEGCGRKMASRSNADLLHRLAIAAGSLQELDAQLEYARDADYLHSAVVEPLQRDLGELRRMLAALIRKLREGDRHAR